MTSWADSGPAVSATFTYDGDGRRVTKTSSLYGTTTYVYDPAGNLAVEYGGQAPASTGPVWLTADHLGSTRLVTSSGACVAAGAHDYLPFGEEIPGGSAGCGRGSVGCYPAADGQTDTDVKFTGQQRDAESNLDFFGARYFSGSQGRFSSAEQPLNDQDHRMVTDS
jgi:RHS repeat-associated protein